MKDTHRILTIPNILSVMRIVMIPFIVLSYCDGKIYLSAILIVLSGITDVVDGFIARHFHMESAVGKALDPIADKLTMAAFWSVCP